MAEEAQYKIKYTKRSLNNIRAIKEYLLYKFTQREVDNLYRKLSDFEKVVGTFPQLFPLIANNKKIHRAVLSKQLAVFYTVSKTDLIIVSILDNRMDNSKWPK